MSKCADCGARAEDDADLCEDCSLNYCSRCGESNDDGEGYDGLCGDCADVAEADGEWN